eukprot:SAG25_NODE_885_length_4932_cov_8.691082_1_plen_242_part_00
MIMGLLLISSICGGARAGDPWGVYGTGLGPEVGCRMHQLAFEQATTRVLPHMLPEGSLRRRQVWDALLTGDMTQSGMGNCSGAGAAPPAGVARPTPALFALPPRAAVTVYVDVDGSDNATGSSVLQPVRTLGRALALSRRRPRGAQAVIVLRAGIHHLVVPLQLTARDSGLTIQNYPHEETWISGATPLPAASRTGWRSWDGAPAGSNVWRAPLPEELAGRKVWGVHELHDPADLSLWQVR